MTTTDNASTSPADELRQAATLMRQRAEQATPGPWRYEPELFDGTVISDSPDVELPWGALVVEPGPTEQARKDGEHIAGWHPAVALAVADLLDSLADYYEPREMEPLPLPLAIADAYLRTAVTHA